MRIRIHYHKNKNLQYTSNLDVQTIWERTFRRAELQLLYSKGFHPQPKIQLACPLPLGLISDAEMMDFWLEEDADLSQVENAVREKTHPGFVIEFMEKVEDKEKALQTRIETASYECKFLESTDRELIIEKISDLLAKETHFQTRRGKQYDLRALINQLDYQFENGEEILSMNLCAQHGATGRPDEVLKALELNEIPVLITRTSLEMNDQK